MFVVGVLGNTGQLAFALNFIANAVEGRFALAIVTFLVGRTLVAARTTVLLIGQFVLNAEFFAIDFADQVVLSNTGLGDIFDIVGIRDA